MTTGELYSEQGKLQKFGPDDHDALSILKSYKILDS